MTPCPRPFRAPGLALLLATSVAAQAASMPIPNLKAFVAGLVAGRYPATLCHETEVGDAPDGVLSISADGHIVGPSIDISMFDPAGELLLQRYVDSNPATLTIDVRVYANGKSFDVDRVVPSDSPGRLEAGIGEPNANITRGSQCDGVDLASARLAAPSFDFASAVAPIFVTARPVKGACRSMQHGRSPTRPVQFMFDGRAVVVDGVTLPLASASQPVVHAALGSRLSDGTANVSYEWADGSSFHAERVFESEAYTTFGFTIHAKPDAQAMFCTSER